MAIARLRRAFLASAVRAASARNCEILRSWRVISFADMLFGNPPGVKFLGGWFRLASCPFHDVRAKLCAAGLRPTRQRMARGILYQCPVEPLAAGSFAARRHRKTLGIKTPGKRMIVW
jgi:hypothetical protein